MEEISFGAKLKLAISTTFHAVWTFLWPKIKVLISKAGPTIMIIMLEAVKAAAGKKDLSNSERKEYAMEFAKNALQTKGIELSGSMVDGLIQDAYVQMREAS
jgi:hypothetical protein